MDKQAQEIEEEIPGATVNKVETVNSDGETVTESITVTFDSGVLFEFNSYALTANSQIELERMANIFKKYPETDIKIDGHTDSKGTEEYNQNLSEQRAAAVADYLASKRISRTRMNTTGYGEMKPVASNETDAGRTANRRVEVAITANEQLQQKANDGSLVVPEN
jgi:outer membrane protein OmpA-like peptidoglycan-associated protein